MSCVTENCRLCRYILGIENFTAYNAKKFKFHPYKIQTVQYLHNSNLAEMFLRFHITTLPILFSHEAHFYIGGYLNKQYFCYWDPASQDKCINSLYITASCMYRPLKLLFFENQRGQGVIVKLQQDEFTVYTVNVSMKAARRYFKRKTVRKGKIIIFCGIHSSRSVFAFLKTCTVDLKNVLISMVVAICRTCLSENPILLYCSTPCVSMVVHSVGSILLHSIAIPYTIFAF